MPVGFALSLSFPGVHHVLYGDLNTWIDRRAIKTSIGVVPLTKLAYPLPYLVEGIALGAVVAVVIMMRIRTKKKQSWRLVEPRRA